MHVALSKDLTPAERRKLIELLKAGLAEHEINATVELERSGLRGRYRLFVTSPDFKKLAESERQDILWRVLRERWTREDQLRITLALASAEPTADAG